VTVTESRGNERWVETREIEGAETDTQSQLAAMHHPREGYQDRLMVVFQSTGGNIETCFSSTYTAETYGEHPTATVPGGYDGSICGTRCWYVYSVVVVAMGILIAAFYCMKWDLSSLMSFG
jgi:hypothetical protein